MARDLDDRYWQAPIPVSLTAAPQEARLAEVIEGLEAAGAGPRRLGYVLGNLMQGNAVDRHGDPREGVVVTAREQMAAARMNAELMGVISKRTKETKEKVLEIRLARAEAGSGEVDGIDGKLLRQLPAAARDAVLKLLDGRGAITDRTST